MSTVDAGIPYKLWVVQLGIWSGKLLRFGSPPQFIFQRFPEFMFVSGLASGEFASCECISEETWELQVML